MATVVSPSNGTRPVTISYIVIPREYISLLASARPPLTCSGELKCTEPITFAVIVFELIALAIPKSESLTFPSTDMIMF